MRSAVCLRLFPYLDGITQRWAEHHRKLLNTQRHTDPSILDEISVIQPIYEMDEDPSLEEIDAAVQALHSSKATGPDEVPAELLKYGGKAVLGCLHSLCMTIWRCGCVPLQWKECMIVSIYKKKRDAVNCNNSRGISLLPTAGKVLARVMLARVIKHISEKVLPEMQCGFSKERETADMIFVARQLQERCTEQHRGLFIVFIDLTKTYDTVNRPLLEDLRVRYDCPPKFLDVLKALHKGAKARVLCGRCESELFLVSVGVR